MSAAYFRLFANCIPVRGARRSLLCDLQNGRLKLIPNSLQEMLTGFKHHSIAEIEAAFPGQESTVRGYFNYLTEQEWGFWCDDPAEFPDLDLRFESPELIGNGIIDVDASSDHDFESLIKQLEELGCEFLEIRAYSPMAKETLSGILEHTQRGRLRGIYLLIRYHVGLLEKDLVEMCREYPRICRLTVHASPFEKTIYALDFMEEMGCIQFVAQEVTGNSHCGVVDPGLFANNLKAFTQAMHFNSCLHKKLSIDVDGTIKNCPSLTEGFGNARRVSLREAVQSPGFQDLWRLTKDQVEVCKVCEFRYICTDCRGFTIGGTHQGKPAKCRYNPYLARWEEEAAGALVV